MVVKYKRNRRVFINIFGVLVLLFCGFTLFTSFKNGDYVTSFISMFLQVVLWFGMYYYQAIRYDEKKIMAQFGWPRIPYDEVISIDEKWGDLIIKSKKHKIGINKDVIDEKSFENFIAHLKLKTQKNPFLNVNISSSK